jgi:hypothetical protein
LVHGKTSSSSSKWSFWSRSQGVEGTAPLQDSAVKLHAWSRLTGQGQQVHEDVQPLPGPLSTMIFGVPPSEVQANPPRVIAVVGEKDIKQARWLLLKLAEKVKGASLTTMQRRVVSDLSPAVALRRKRGLTPALSREQAMEIWAAVAPGSPLS